MGKVWHDCIIVLIDLVGARERADCGLASNQMRALHRTIVREIETGNYSFVHAYAYNDSVLTMSFVDKTSESFAKAMRDADALKKQVDRIQTSYAIAVKGRAFPSELGSSKHAPVTVIEASSWAMANCFEIEKELRRLRKSWYLDSRIAKRLQLSQLSQKHRVKMYPSGSERAVHVFNGYLWANDDA